MSMSDRLDEITARCDAATEGSCLVAALRAVLELHVSQFDRTVDHDGEPGTYCDACNVGPWPCSTVRAVQAALGEGS